MHTGVCVALFPTATNGWPDQGPVKATQGVWSAPVAVLTRSRNSPERVQEKDLGKDLGKGSGENPGRGSREGSGKWVQEKDLGKVQEGAPQFWSELGNLEFRRELHSLGRNSEI